MYVYHQLWHWYPRDTRLKGSLPTNCNTVIYFYKQVTDKWVHTGLSSYRIRRIFHQEQISPISPPACSYWRNFHHSKILSCVKDCIEDMWWPLPHWWKSFLPIQRQLGLAKLLSSKNFHIFDSYRSLPLSLYATSFWDQHWIRSVLSVGMLYCTFPFLLVYI